MSKADCTAYTFSFIHNLLSTRAVVPFYPLSDKMLILQSRLCCAAAKICFLPLACAVPLERLQNMHKFSNSLLLALTFWKNKKNSVLCSVDHFKGHWLHHKVVFLHYRGEIKINNTLFRTSCQNFSRIDESKSKNMQMWKCDRKNPN